MKKKIVINIILILVALVLLVPIPLYAKDGGTVTYQAILYSVTDYHSIKDPEGFYTGIEIKILGITVYENTTFEK